MIHYAAFLRGIGPGDPAKSNESLRGAFEKMGFADVRSFISSGNILFASEETDTKALEQRIQEGLTKHLGINAPTAVRSSEQLQSFLQAKPFDQYRHSANSYLTVTFLKSTPNRRLSDIQADARDRGYYVLNHDESLQAVCSMIDQTNTKATDFMVWLERQYGKDITTRTLNTIERVAKRLV